ncbi:uncharacterized protein LOC142320969 isoform X2 [Lycorma delicatula]|uniref:uncharacterized protein LOC142320969 isoform X2 n=1 Tax=Lycorma delicatula TaxID=130591 RepID=UPI003F51A7BA
MKFIIKILVLFISLLFINAKINKTTTNILKLKKTFSTMQFFNKTMLIHKVKTKALHFKHSTNTTKRTTNTEVKLYPYTRDLKLEERIALASKENNNCYYKFVSRNGTEIYIRVRVKPKSLRNEVTDMNKQVVTIDVNSLGFGKNSNKQVLSYIQGLLKVNETQLEIVSGNMSEHKIIKLTGYKDTRFSVLYKFVDAWEPFEDSEDKS